MFSLLVSVHTMHQSAWMRLLVLVPDSAYYVQINDVSSDLVLATHLRDICWPLIISLVDPCSLWAFEGWTNRLDFFSLSLSHTIFKIIIQKQQGKQLVWGKWMDASFKNTLQLCLGHATTFAPFHLNELGQINKPLWALFSTCTKRSWVSSAWNQGLAKLLIPSSY